MAMRAWIGFGGSRRPCPRKRVAPECLEHGAETRPVVTDAIVEASSRDELEELVGRLQSDVVQVGGDRDCPLGVLAVPGEVDVRLAGFIAAGALFGGDRSPVMSGVVVLAWLGDVPGEYGEGAAPFQPVVLVSIGLGTARGCSQL